MADESNKRASAASRAKRTVSATRPEIGFSAKDIAAHKIRKSSTPKATEGKLVTGKVERLPKMRVVEFGSARIRARAPSRDEISRNVEAGNSALKRAAKVFANPGVKLSRRKNVPLYRADPNHPNILIRELNGHSERVILVGGEFKPAE